MKHVTRLVLIPTYRFATLWRKACCGIDSVPCFNVHSIWRTLLWTVFRCG